MAQEVRAWHRIVAREQVGTDTGDFRAIAFDARGVPRPVSWRLRRLVLVLWDSGAWTVALFLATFLRYELDATQINPVGLAIVTAVAIVTQLGVGAAMRLYQGRYWIGSVDDAINVTITMAIVGIVVFGVDLLSPIPFIPRSVPLTATLTALVLAWGIRLVVRRYRERSSRPDNGSAQRVIIFGAGSDGQQLVRSMLSDPTSGYLPVALLDDDPGRQSRRVSGVAVRGTRADVATVASQTGAQLLIIAQRGADGSFVREVARAATDAGMRVKVLPPLIELLRPWVGISDLRDLDISDLLGRRPVDIDVSAIASYLSNRRVLVTGAGGSIGSELCRQIGRFGPAELIMLDRDESALHATQLSIYGRALLDSPDVVLCDIRDVDAITAVFADRRPDVVFHAAALKHLPMLEQYPDEAWKTNVLGTQNVVEAAQKINVRSFVNISTDKAANPTSVLGRSKRIGEQLVAHAAFDGPACSSRCDSETSSAAAARC